MDQPHNIKSECATFPDDLAEIKAERDALRLELAQARAELDRRDRNENRNCINWGPCSRNDNHMEGVD